MQLYFIRHGQSANNALWEKTGSNSGRSHDPTLTETGRCQAHMLGAFLRDAGAGFAPDGQDLQNRAGFGLTHLYTSLMVRAVATGTIVAQTLKIPLVAWVDLHEGGGIYLDDENSGEPVGLPGNPRSFFEQNFPGLALPDWLDESGWWNRPFESRLERRTRARRVLGELLLRHGNCNDRVAMISHGGFYNHLMAVLLKPPEVDRPPSPQAVQALIGDNVIMTDEREVWFNMNNTAITRIDFVEEEVKLVYMNRLDFLSGDLVT
jgi:2,3-bisphosphoglycerate-dependent phosphoglycerate mutase